MLTVIVSMLSSLFDSGHKTAQAWVDDGRLAQSAPRARVVAIATAVTGDAEGSTVDITLNNEGKLSYADFDHWDVNLEYVNQSGQIERRWLPYSSEVSDDAWTVQGIYLVASLLTDEVVDKGVLNASEEIVLRLRVTPPMQSGSTARAVLTPTKGGPTSIFFTG